MIRGHKEKRLPVVWGRDREEETSCGGRFTNRRQQTSHSERSKSQPQGRLMEYGVVDSKGGRGREVREGDLYLQQGWGRIWSSAGGRQFLSQEEGINREQRGRGEERSE